jgi:malonyl-CoA O-methyltransferase
MNMALVSKKAHIAKRFGQAASSYNENALVQREVITALSKWANFKEVQSFQALDIGCGTGDIAKRFTKMSSHWLNLDISVNMLKNAASSHLSNEHNSLNQSYLCADAESLPLRDNSLDFICSSMALQWCDSPSSVMGEINRVLKNDGRAILAIMIAPSFSVLNRAWESIEMASRVNAFNDPAQWLNAAKPFTWKVKSELRSFSTSHSSLVQMLKSIKGVGANTLTSNKKQAAFSKTELAKLECYFSEKAALKLDYELLFLDLRK